MHKSGKRYSETAAKVAAGRARKNKQAYEKRKLEREALELEEAKKWEQGTRQPNRKKLEQEEKRNAKVQAKKEREALLAMEEEELGKGGKGRRV
ncbi:hypothetical protein KAFR_0J00600 [Kazachstania africana CBS 2517]|uniref:LSO1/LSO2 domain-containing protein n=1 Tax=Kazachstania africana (strain ATCC 22294 / BCRC 22015 / CBS 2517 / CECT 1963 / NBRC 1671 / NRRL Y-8276) TaxID=1071382 RepID=H2B0H8_KAZAF|nr:hypothetical protein KAFR_0J00600 [Kazachstania africana CBS 2517]CCF60128.1 hypothetical protein KAFR_0J00600 [Kazachstania africana CBS 2517]